jgi:hypothetical protein
VIQDVFWVYYVTDPNLYGSANAYHSADGKTWTSTAVLEQDKKSFGISVRGIVDTPYGVIATVANDTDDTLVRDAD